jgi:hypothetical protein
MKLFECHRSDQSFWLANQTHPFKFYTRPYGGHSLYHVPKWTCPKTFSHYLKTVVCLKYNHRSFLLRTTPPVPGNLGLQQNAYNIQYGWLNFFPNPHLSNIWDNKKMGLGNCFDKPYWRRHYRSTFSGLAHIILFSLLLN